MTRATAPACRAKCRNGVEATLASTPRFHFSGTDNRLPRSVIGYRSSDKLRVNTSPIQLSNRGGPRSRAVASFAIIPGFRTRTARMNVPPCFLMNTLPYFRRSIRASITSPPLSGTPEYTPADLKCKTESIRNRLAPSNLWIVVCSVSPPSSA